MRLLWPWVLLLLPLPWAVRRWLPPARTIAASLRVPFFESLRTLPRSRARGARTPGWAWLAWLLLVLAAARPQWVPEPDARPVTGRDLLLAVDISGSMGGVDFTLDGRDFNRLEAVQRVGGAFIERRRGDRVGLILFGTRPYTMAPLTHDRGAVRRMLQDAELTLAGQSTAVGDAIGLAVKRLRGRPADSRVLVLLTDGGHNAGEVPPLEAARLASRHDVRIYTVGVGPDKAVPRPNRAGTWEEGASGLDRKVLAEVARLTGGRYFHAFDASAMEAAYAALDRLEPSLGDAVESYLARPLYPWPLALALLITAAAARRKGVVRHG